MTVDNYGTSLHTVQESDSWVYPSSYSVDRVHLSSELVSSDKIYSSEQQIHQMSMAYMLPP